MDAYTPLKKQYWILKCILTMYKEGIKIVEKEGFEFEDFLKMPVLEKLARCKDIPAEELEKYEALEKEVIESIQALQNTIV